MKDKYRKALKGYSTSALITNLVSSIQKILLQFGATGIGFEYDNEERITSISFKLEDGTGNTRVIRVPSQWEKVKQKLIMQKVYKDDEHAYRVAMYNIKEWLDAQLAIMEIGLVEFKQIFLPYMTNSEGKTVYEYFEESQYKLLDTPK